VVGRLARVWLLYQTQLVVLLAQGDVATDVRLLLRWIRRFVVAVAAAAAVTGQQR